MSIEIGDFVTFASSGDKVMWVVLGVHNYNLKVQHGNGRPEIKLKARATHVVWCNWCARPIPVAETVEVQAGILTHADYAGKIHTI